MPASYLSAYSSGLLAARVDEARGRLSDCTLCPRECHVDRLAGDEGDCRVGADAEVASASPHFGEEPPLVGRGGSGTVFLASCNLRCVFCQNFDISQGAPGRQIPARGMGAMMVDLQRLGCHNINWVTPSHQVPALLEGLVHAIQAGLSLPLVYNTSGYDAVETLRLLDGIVDIYMPDLKTLDPQCAETYLTAADYPAVTRAALKEMHRQVGDLQIGDDGVATRGLLLRHLVMPDDLATTREALCFVRDQLSPNTYVNIMAQWHPAGDCARHPALNKPLRRREHARALEIAAELGLTRLDRRTPKRGTWF